MKNPPHKKNGLYKNVELFVHQKTHHEDSTWQPREYEVLTPPISNKGYSEYTKNAYQTKRLNRMWYLELDPGSEKGHE